MKERNVEKKREKRRAKMKMSVLVESSIIVLLSSLTVQVVFF